jgi:hypothetical protein
MIHSTTLSCKNNHKQGSVFIVQAVLNNPRKNQGTEIKILLFATMYYRSVYRMDLPTSTHQAHKGLV